MKVIKSYSQLYECCFDLDDDTTYRYHQPPFVDINSDEHQYFLRLCDLATEQTIHCQQCKEPLITKFPPIEEYVCAYCQFDLELLHDLKWAEQLNNKKETQMSNMWRSIQEEFSGCMVRVKDNPHKVGIAQTYSGGGRAITGWMAIVKFDMEDKEKYCWPDELEYYVEPIWASMGAYEYILNHRDEGPKSLEYIANYLWKYNGRRNGYALDDWNEAKQIMRVIQ